MSFDSFLRHTLTVKRNAATGTFDAYGQPVGTVAVVATVRGLIQPRSAKELALTSQAGAVIGSHIGYLRAVVGLGTDCWLDRDGIRYDILSMSDAAGQGHHLELSLQAVT